MIGSFKHMRRVFPFEKLIFGDDNLCGWKFISCVRPDESLVDQNIKVKKKYTFFYRFAFDDKKYDFFRDICFMVKEYKIVQRYLFVGDYFFFF